MTQEVEIPEGSPALDQVVDAATAGTVTYLTREGQRVEELAEFLLPEPAVEDDDPGLSADKSRRRLEVVARAQGVQP